MPWKMSPFAHFGGLLTQSPPLRMEPGLHFCYLSTMQVYWRTGRTLGMTFRLTAVAIECGALGGERVVCGDRYHAVKQTLQKLGLINSAVCSVKPGSFFARESIKPKTMLPVKLGPLWVGYPLDCNRLCTLASEAGPAIWDVERGTDGKVASNSWQVISCLKDGGLTVYLSQRVPTAIRREGSWLSSLTSIVNTSPSQGIQKFNSAR